MPGRVIQSPHLPLNSMPPSGLPRPSAEELFSTKIFFTQKRLFSTLYLPQENSLNKYVSHKNSFYAELAPSGTAFGRNLKKVLVEKSVEQKFFLCKEDVFVE